MVFINKKYLFQNNNIFIGMKKLLFLLILFVFNITLFAQTERPLHEIHASFIYNVTKYVVWSNENNGNTNFVIGVWGDDELFKSTNNWYSGKNKNGKKILVKDIKTLNEISDCDLIYLGKYKISQFNDVKALVTNKPILLMTDQQNYGRKGSCVNIPILDGTIKIELNMNSLNSGSFKVSGSLTMISKLIN
jgi:hypothetical protein